MTARWNGPDGDWRTEPSTLSVDLYRVTQEPTVEQRGLRRVLDIEAARHAKPRLDYLDTAWFWIAVLVLVVVPVILGYAELIQQVVWHWRGIAPWAFAAFLVLVFLVACRRQAVRSRGRVW